MNATLKYEIVEKIIQSHNDDVLNEIKYLLNMPEQDFWHDLPLEIKESIKEGENQLDRGEGIAHLDVMREIKNKFLSK